MAHTTMIEPSLDVPSQPRMAAPPEPARPKVDQGFSARTALAFFGTLGFALFFVAYSIYVDVLESGAPRTNLFPFILLGLGLVIALGFEFVTARRSGSG